MFKNVNLTGGGGFHKSPMVWLVGNCEAGRPLLVDGISASLVLPDTSNGQGLIRLELGAVVHWT